MPAHASWQAGREFDSLQMVMYYKWYMKTYSFRTIIEKDGKSYHGFVPSLPGCRTFGKTVEETKKNLNEAIEGYLISCVKHGDKIPEDTGFQSIEMVSIPFFLKKGKPTYA